MPSKRKRDLFDFDPNKSDSEDENFVLGADGEDRPRRTKKKSKGTKSHRSTGRRTGNRYRGSDIDDDDEEVSDDSLGGSFIEDDDDDDDEDAPLTSTGRRARKAAVVHPSYKESSEDEEEEEVLDNEDEEEEEINDDEDDQPLHVTPRPRRKASITETPRRSRIVTLKMKPRNLRERAAMPGRRTRGTTEEADEFLELSVSGRHARPARSSRSRSPETLAAAGGIGGRTRRASKGLKKPPAPAIEEATQESSVPLDVEEAEGSPLGGGDGAEESTLRDHPAFGATHDFGDEEAAETAEAAEADELPDTGEGQGEVDELSADQVHGDITMEEDDHDEDDDDVMPLGNRRTRQTRAAAAAAAAAEDISAAEEAEEAGDEGDGTIGRRLTRGSRLRSKKAKSAKEPSSDFEPMEDEQEDFDSDASQKNEIANDGADDSSSNSRGRRRSTRLKTGSKRHRESDEEDDVDRDEVAMEAQELRASSHSRPRRRRRSPSIVYEETSRRRTTKVVDYSIKPLDQFIIEQEEEEQEAIQTPARRRNARNGGNASTWQRNLLSTFGPFGGGGGVGSLIGGPWGTGAAGGVDSDSSDDEMNNRTSGPGGIGAPVGMTPNAGTAASGFAAPLNLESITGVSAANNNVGKIKNHKALADADPLGVDMTVDFSKVGGLQGHINQLKEMVTLPLLYPELFLRFKVTPPRGVLFHGPPGTGKTLLARALANSVGVGGRKITFYMRKGADALSKWVGEAEKQLRLLFEEARRTQPSIIFFDEIDGLAPVRSSKQEQIHASIVSTLLALMDGMDGRGQVIVIGATNRPDNIDPALRRPGRFDREFYFPLPDLEGRRSIINIHTKDWGLSDDFKEMLAERSKGYGGADLRALCTEAALNAIQRTYPQIYSSQEKLIVSPEKIAIHATDFALSMKRMIPSSERSAAPAWAPLPKAVAPLLSAQFSEIKKLLDGIMPRQKKTTALEEAMYEPYQDADHGFGRENMIQEFERSRTFRPRLILTGIAGMGQSYLSAAILNYFEGVHIQSFDLPILLGDGRPLEQVIVSHFIEVKRHKPAVIFIPNVDVWYTSLPPSAYLTFSTMLKNIPPNDPVLVLGTYECEESEVPTAVISDFFGYSSKNKYALKRPSKESRREYFMSFLEHAAKSPGDFPDPANRKKRVLEELPVAPPPPPKVRTKEEIREELRKDHLLLNLLKVQLQPIMDQIKKYKKFRQPVISDTQISYLWQEADPNYVQPDIPMEEPHPFVIAHDREGAPGLLEKATGKFYYNLDLATIEERLSNGYYTRPKDFYNDVVSLAKDAKNIGDKERLLKANELVTNVEVDVAEAEARLSQVNWDDLYQRQLKRAKDAEERAAKRKVGLAIMGAITEGDADDGTVPLIASDIVQEDGAGDGNGDEAAEGVSAQHQLQTQARFAVKPAFVQGVDASSSEVTSNGYHGSRSNGTSVPSGLSNDDDVVMTGSNLDGTTDAVPRPQGSGLGLSAPDPTAGNTQVSQISAVTGLPADLSPSAVINEASTTKSSGPWSTQASNGVHNTGAGGSAAATIMGAGSSGPEVPEGSGSQALPDTQSVPGTGPSQSTPLSGWHSELHANEVGGGSGNLGGSFEVLGSSPASSSPPQPRQQSQLAVQPLGPPPPPNASLNATSVPGASLSLQLQIQSKVQIQSQLQSQSPSQSHAAVVPSQATEKQAQPPASQQQQGEQKNASSGSTQATQPSSQALPISVPPGEMEATLADMLERTSGCTVDQLEQISREIMEYIWSSRDETNRAKVVSHLSIIFNSTIQDMEEVQGLTTSFSQRRRQLQ